MSLPDMITDFFNRIQSGILDPLTSGLYGIMPGMLVVAVIVSVLVLAFAKQVGAKIGAVATLILCCAMLPNIPEFVNAVMSWFGGMDVTDHASEVAKQGLQAGLGELGD